MIAHRDGKATVYLNELSQIARVRVARPIEAGSPVLKDDIIDVDRLELGIEIPADAGVLFLFSVGWRKGLYYDFGPIGGPDPPQREFDCSHVFGQAYCQLMFQERFRILETEWIELLNAKWFPFAGLRHRTIDKLLDYVRASWNPDELLDQIIAEVRDGIPRIIDAWRRHSSFTEHIGILERAVERFQADDYVSCTGLLYPRIEGLLRTHYSNTYPSLRPSPDRLTDAAVESHVRRSTSLLLPHKFSGFLRDIYFANFNPQAQQIDVSRHSVAHGVAHASEFNAKSALIGILVVQQLFYLIPTNSPDS